MDATPVSACGAEPKGAAFADVASRGAFGSRLATGPVYPDVEEAGRPDE